MKRLDRWQVMFMAIIYPAVLALVAWACVVSYSLGQLPQPGDTPAPVVQMESSGEHNELTASITGPATARAGSIIAFDVSGSSDEGQELQFRPHVPDDAIRWDSGGEIVYAAIGRPGHYKVIWSVDDGHAADVKVLNLEVHGGEPPDTPDDPDPPPGDVALLKFVEALTAEVQGASNHDTVAETFRGLALRIELDQLRGSQAIYDATKAALFGATESRNPEWKPFFNALMPHLLNVKHVATQKQWQAAYEVVAEGVRK